MLDISLFRHDLASVAAGLAKRGVALDTAAFESLERERKDIQVRTQELQNRRNVLSKDIGAAKAKGGDASALLAEVAGAGDALKTLEAELDRVQTKLRDFLLLLPNLTHASVPEGRGSEENVEARRWGVPRAFGFAVRDHTDLGEGLGLLDFATAAKLSGSRFSLLRGELARLHRALAQFMLDVRRASTATSNAIRPTSSTPRRSSGPRSSRSSKRTCSRCGRAARKARATRST